MARGPTGVPGYSLPVFDRRLRFFRQRRGKCVRSTATLRKQFDAYRLHLSITPVITITDAGVMLGAGTLLMRLRNTRLGLQQLALTDDRERALALHCVAFDQAPSLLFLHHLSSAAGYWPHDKALANIRLVFADLPKLASETDAWRLHLAAALLDDEFPPSRLMSELGFAPFDFQKYDPDQPRVPAGSGRQSGEWGSANSTANTPKAQSTRTTSSSGEKASADSDSDQSADSATRALESASTRIAESFLDDLPGEALTGLTEFASDVAAPMAFYGALFIPSQNPGIESDGTLPGSPDITYKADHDSGLLELSTQNADGTTTTIRAQLQDGVYVDVSTNTPLGRDLDGTLYIDRDAAVAALNAAKGQLDEDAEVAPAPKDNEPKLCPDETRDNPGATVNSNAVEYAQYVSQNIVNPQRDPPLKEGMAFGLLNPETGQVVLFDDCQDTTGIMQEYKGYYAWAMNNDKLKRDRATDFLTQADDQVAANNFRNLQTGADYPIDWHFNDKEVADFAWELFDDPRFRNKIRVFYTPRGKHTSERIWGIK
jgi:hypothetical protein